MQVCVHNNYAMKKHVETVLQGVFRLAVTVTLVPLTLTASVPLVMFAETASASPPWPLAVSVTPALQTLTPCVPLTSGVWAAPVRTALSQGDREGDRQPARCSTLPLSLSLTPPSLSSLIRTPSST